MASALALVSVDEEHSALDQQLAILRGGGSVVGDLSKKFRCGTAQGLVASGAILVAGGPAAGIAAATGVVMGVAVAATGGLAGVAVVLSCSLVGTPLQVLTAALQQGPPQRLESTQAALAKRIGDLAGVGEHRVEREAPRTRQVQHRPADRVEPVPGVFGEPVAQPDRGASFDHVEELPGAHVDDRGRPRLSPPSPEPGEQHLIDAECFDGADTGGYRRRAGRSHTRSRRR